MKIVLEETITKDHCRFSFSNKFHKELFNSQCLVYSLPFVKKHSIAGTTVKECWLYCFWKAFEQ